MQPLPSGLDSCILQASVLRAALGEITTQESENWVYPLWSIGWDLSIMLGPLVGAALAQPAEQYPGSWIGRSALLQKFPFFLPCAVAAGYAVVAFGMIFFFFEEVSTPASRRGSILTPSADSSHQSESERGLGRERIRDGSGRVQSTVVACSEARGSGKA